MLKNNGNNLVLVILQYNQLGSSVIDGALVNNNTNFCIKLCLLTKFSTVNILVFIFSYGDVIIILETSNKSAILCFIESYL